jgi:biopolymer transport protein ExbD
MRKRPSLSAEEESLEEPLVNLTPLIDVVFVVLIAFMLIAPILNIDSIQLASGGPSSKKELPAVQNNSLSISIRADHSLWFQGEKIDLKNLAKKLQSEKNKWPRAIPQLIPDAHAHFETYQQVKNIVESCGFEQMDVVLKTGSS